MTNVDDCSVLTAHNADALLCPSLGNILTSSALLNLAALMGMVLGGVTLGASTNFRKGK
jgi:hypothetical protein